MAGTLLCGLVPFDPRSPASVLVGRPRPLAPFGSTAPVRIPSTVRILTSSTPRRVFLEAVLRTTEHIRHTGLEKVVLARHVDLMAEEPWMVRDILERLPRRGRAARFAVRAGSMSVVGVSPELLVSHDGAEIRSTPLAGSRARPSHAAGIARTTAELLRSPKDRHEHRLVVDPILKTFSMLGPVRRRKRVLRTSDSLHLMTDLRVSAVDTGIRALDLARQLHPTAAVCGTPTDAAMDVIRASEDRQRGYFTGIVGWEAPDGTGEWWLVIRSALVDGRSATVSAGAGIVDGSDPRAEFTETEHKMRPMLRALGAPSYGCDDEEGKQAAWH